MNKILFVFIMVCTLSSKGQIIKEPLQAIAMNGKYISISPGSAQAIVLFFTDTRCPYDEHYLPRMKKYASQFEGKIRFFFINSSAEDTPEEIKNQAETWGASIPYLHDADQAVFRAVAAKRTSEVFLLEKSADGLQLSYRGPLDDNPQVAEDADRNYLLDAINAILNKQTPPLVSARVAGCFIRTKH